MRNAARILCRVALLAAFFFICFFSIVPDPPSGPRIPFFDKVAHFTAYAALGFLCVASFLTYANRRAVIVLSIIFCIMIGVSLEAVQYFVGRNAEITDALSDLIGGALGALCGLPISRRLFTQANTA